MNDAHPHLSARPIYWGIEYFGLRVSLLYYVEARTISVSVWATVYHGHRK